MKSLTKRELGSLALAIEILVIKELGDNIILEESTRAGKDWFIHFVVLDKLGKYRGQDYTFFGGSIAKHKDVNIQGLVQIARDELVSLGKHTIELAIRQYPDYEKMQGKPNIVNSFVKFMF